MDPEKQEQIPSKEELLGEAENTEVTAAESAENTEEYSEAEQEAISKGWKPEGVEGKRNLSAEEFLDREKFYNDIHSLQRQNKKLQQDVANMAKFQKQIREDERKKVISELNSQKKQALEDQDYDKVINIDKQIFEEMQAPKVEEVQENNTEAFENWVSQNRWYHTDPDMREYADTIGIGYANRNPNLSPEEIFNYVEKQVKKTYSDKFAPPEQATNKVASSSRKPVKPKSAGASKSDLSAEELQIMRTMVKSGALTEEEYLKEYSKINS